MMIIIMLTTSLWSQSSSSSGFSSPSTKRFCVNFGVQVEYLFMIMMMIMMIVIIKIIIKMIREPPHPVTDFALIAVSQPILQRSSGSYNDFHHASP